MQGTIVILAVAAAASIAAASDFGFLALAAITALVGVRLAVRHMPRNLWSSLIVMVGSAAGALIFLPAVRGQSGRRQELVYYGIVVGIAAVAAVLALDRRALHRRLVGSLRHLRVSSLDAVMWGSVAMAFVAFTAGFIEGNEASFLIGDTYQLLLVPALYFIFSTSMQSTDDIDILLPIVVGLLLMQQARDLVTGAVLLSTTDLRRINAVLWLHNLVGLVGALVLAMVNTGRQRRVWILVSGAFVAVGLMSGFRTYVLLVALTAAVLLVLGPRTFIGMTFAALVVIVPLALAIYVSAPSVQDTTRGIVRSYVERSRVGSASDVSTRQRWIEVEVVREQVLNTGLQHTIIGLGAGATFKLPASASADARRLYQDTGLVVHNVHFTPAAYALRHGLVGLIYLAWLLAVSSLWAIRGLANAHQIRRWFAPIAVIAYLVASVGFDFVTGDVVFALVLAILSVETNERTRVGGHNVPDPFSQSTRPIAVRLSGPQPGRRSP